MAANGCELIRDVVGHLTRMASSCPVTTTPPAPLPAPSPLIQITFPTASLPSTSKDGLTALEGVGLEANVAMDPERKVFVMNVTTSPYRWPSSEQPQIIRDVKTSFVRTTKAFKMPASYTKTMWVRCERVMGNPCRFISTEFADVGGWSGETPPNAPVHIWGFHRMSSNIAAWHGMVPGARPLGAVIVVRTMGHPSPRLCKNPRLRLRWWTDGPTLL